MVDTFAEVATLRAIENPLQREAAARQAAEAARELIEAVRLVRAEAIKQVYDVFGGTKASRLLRVNRVNLYRLMEPARTEAEKAARAEKWVLAAEVTLRALMSMSAGTQELVEEGDT